jgi:carbonic anhydrase
MPLGLSAGEYTRIRRLKTSANSLNDPVIDGFGYTTMEYSGTPSTTSGATAMVLTCIDPRYTYAIEQYLLNQLDAQHSFDLFALAGSSLGASVTGSTAANLRSNYKWQEVFFEHLQIAKLLHNIQNVWVFDHLDCGAYKNFYSPPLSGPNGPDCLQQPHVNVFNSLKSNIQSSGIPSISGLNIQGWIMTSPECPRNGCTGCNSTSGCLYSISGTTSTYTNLCTYIPPNTGASVLVLGCIDPRYASLLSSFLINYKDVQFSYDLLTLAGASIGVNQSYLSYPSSLRTAGVAGSQYPLNSIPQFGVNWGPMLFEHINIALALHSITEIWVFDHLDCGAYKAILGLATDLDPKIHTTQLDKLKGFISQTYPSLGYKGFVMDTSGKITKVSTNSKGINLDNIIIKDFGSSRIRNPASEFTDMVGREALSYPVNSQIPGVPGTSFGNRTKIYNLCNCSTKTL